MNAALLQISDPHFGTEISPVVDALRALAKAVDPRVVIVSGDITQRARRSQFAAARRFFDSLNAPHLISTPGNHDIPMLALATRLLLPYSHWAQRFGTDLEPTLESDRLLVQCVNTTRWFRRKHGQISKEQIERVTERLRRSSPEQLRIVVMHHPVLAVREVDYNNLLRGHGKATAAWMGAGVDIVMGGHIHLPYIRPLHAEVQQPPHRSWVVQAGTALSHRTRDGIANSVNIVRYADSGPVSCAVERWDFQAASNSFERVHSVALPLTRSENAPQPPAGESIQTADATQPHS